MLSGAYRTPEREQYAHYSSVVGMVSPNLLFVRQSLMESFEATTLEEALASDFRLGAQIDVSYSDDYDNLVHDSGYRDEIVYLSKRELLWRMLAQNRIDGVIASQLTGLYEIAHLGLSDQIVPGQIVISDKPAYFIFSKRSLTLEFVSDFDRELRSLIKDGTFSAIVRRYVCPDFTPEEIVPGQL